MVEKLCIYNQINYNDTERVINGDKNKGKDTVVRRQISIFAFNKILYMIYTVNYNLVLNILNTPAS